MLQSHSEETQLVPLFNFLVEIWISCHHGKIFLAPSSVVYMYMYMHVCLIIVILIYDSISIAAIDQYFLATGFSPLSILQANNGY